MASWDHEGIVELFRSDPGLAVELLRGPLGLELPPFAVARVETGALTQLNPAELRADLVISLSNNGEHPVLAVIVEAQRDQDDDKLFSWPAYVGSLRHRLRCPVCVLVVTQSERVANWASRTITVGPGCSLSPLVLRPSSVPVISLAEEARQAPELAVLSAMAHGGGAVETAVQVALAAATAAHELGRDRFLLYFGLIRAALSEAARKAFQMLPQGAQFFDESQKQSFDRGRAAEKAAAVLEVLDARGLAVTAAQRERILSTKELETLTHWVRRAATIASADALFE
ncbi:MAG TPA: hypothetical protein VFQ61_04820 [Polyangiaceae bacterium]|nr:hypothetical protein [Polyangiaceae bacterium]